MLGIHSEHRSSLSAQITQAFHLRLKVVYEKVHNSFKCNFVELKLSAVGITYESHATDSRLIRHVYDVVLPV